MFGSIWNAITSSWNFVKSFAVETVWGNAVKIFDWTKDKFFSVVDIVKGWFSSSTKEANTAS